MSAQNGNHDFFLEQQRAVERMRETANRSRYAPPQKSAPPPPPPPEPAKAPPPQKQDSLDNILSRLDIPILNRIRTDSDTALIIGLFLLLAAEKSDRLFLLALIYILL